MTALCAAAPQKIANLEAYLFETVGPHFQQTHELSTEDFWLILMWKSNRSKTKTKAAVKSQLKLPFAQAVEKIVVELKRLTKPRDKLEYLIYDCSIGLPTATAILTVLLPDTFTVYDVRVRTMLGMKEISRRRQKMWDQYAAYVAAVIAKGAADLSLRDKDRSLWGRSVLTDVGKAIA